MHKRKKGRREARLRECLSVDSSKDEGGGDINYALEESYSVEDEAIVDEEEGGTMKPSSDRASETTVKRDTAGASAGARPE